MPGLPVVASSPIAFSSAEGQYFLIPLSAVEIDSGGAAKADLWPLYGTYKAILDPLLADLVSSGTLVPGSAPAKQPAFTATAKTPGASGIDLQIAIANVVPNAAAPPSSTADVSVTETDTYVGIAFDKLIDTIGNAANGGQRPGLVFVSSPAPTLLPDAGAFPMTAAAPGNPATVDIPKHGGGGTAFTLKTRDGGADAVNTSIQIKDVNVTQNTYTLAVKWTKSQNAVAMSGLGAAFDFVVTIAAPPGGFVAPAAGTTQLSGGSDAVAVNPVKASAVILSN